MRVLPYSLQGRFLTGLLAVILVMGIFFAFALHEHMKELFLSEARAKANLMASHTEAIQDYVREVLRPAISHAIKPDAFIIEAMSTSFVTRHILSALSTEESDFTYRRVAKNARNPEYEVNREESEYFERFASKPGLTRIERTARVQGREYLTVARPVYFSADCMHCHGDPKDAPAVLLRMYGDKRGFWRKPGELAGLDIISVPVESASGSISRSVTVFAVFFGTGMLILLLVVQFFFNRLVVHNLRRVGAILHSRFFREEEEKGLLAPLQKEEEIEGMVRAIERIATHLSDARLQLRDYAKNLESMVKDRTADLESVASERSADVSMFVRLLGGLSGNVEKLELLRTSLELIARHFGARRAVYACGLSGSDFMVWPPLEGGDAALDPGQKQELARQLPLGQPELSPHVWHIPVQTSGQSRGVLGLYWDNAAPPREQLSLALAFGHQLGIALDNLDALDALLRQNSLLDSLVEGISDPLILAERDSVPLIANASARLLAARLPGGSVDAPLPALLELMLGGRAPGADLSQPGRHDVDLGESGSFAVSVYPLPAGSGHADRAVIHIRETTKEQIMLLHLRQNDKLAAVGRLAAGLAHEINNPLGVIRCYSELLGKMSLGEQGRADLDVILRHVDQAQSVLRDMLDFSRPHSPCPGPCDVAELLGSTLELFRPKARSLRMGMELDLPRPPGLVRLDARMLKQVVVNLLLNAFDAVREAQPRGGGRVLVRAVRDDAAGTLAISVADSGGGIKARDRDKIFDPFFTTKAPGAGTGLGLTVTFGMVRDMGGRLDLTSPSPESAENAGAVFTVTLPLESPEFRENPATPKHPASSALSSPPACAKTSAHQQTPAHPEAPAWPETPAFPERKEEPPHDR